MNLSTSPQAVKFSARFRNMSPQKKNVMAGVTTAAGGIGTLGSQVAASVQGYPFGASALINLAVGAWNTYVGHENIKNNGGLGKLKDPH